MYAVLPDVLQVTDLGPMLFGRPIGMPRLDRDFNPERTGRNFIFFSSMGYIIAVCFQSYSMQVWMYVQEVMRSKLRRSN